MTTQKPPQVLPRLLRWVLGSTTPARERDIVLGDFEEYFQVLTNEKSAAYALIWATFQLIDLVPRRLAQSIIAELAMLKSYLYACVRQLRKHKTSSAISLASLALGIAFSVLALLYVQNELAYDEFHERKNQLVRVHTVWSGADGSELRSSQTHPAPFGPALERDFPEVDGFVRVRSGTSFVRSEALESSERLLYADASMLSMFTFPLRYGNSDEALATPESVVISERAAIRYFGAAEALGRTLEIRLGSTYEDFVVAGVAESIPGNSTIKFDFLLQLDRLFDTPRFSIIPEPMDDWGFTALQTYLLLNPTSSIEGTERNIAASAVGYFEDEEGASESRSFRLEPLTAIHAADAKASQKMYFLSGIALAILLISCTNFATMALGRTARRTVEVGIRKVAGAERKQLVFQYWGETLFQSLLALVGAAALITFFLPVFNSLLGISLSLTSLNAWTLAAVVLIVAFSALVGGSYPALVLSRLRPIEAISRRVRFGRSSLFLRTLVVAQFSVSVVLIAGTISLKNQIDYAQSFDPGFQRDGVVVVSAMGHDAAEVASMYRRQASEQAGIVDATATSNTFGNSYFYGVDYEVDGVTHEVDLFKVESNFLAFMDLELLEGRDFDPERQTDKGQSIIVNEALVSHFGIQDPIGKTVPGFGENSYSDGTDPVIVGVVKDHNFNSLYLEIAPMIYTQDLWSFTHTLVRVAPGDLSERIGQLRSIWRANYSETPFQYSFLDDRMRAAYAADARLSRVVTMASGFAVLLAFLGLFGLSALAASTRTREIGIRKVLGASAAEITREMSWEFIRLVLAGILLSLPLAYLVMQKWLGSFAYRPDSEFGVLAITSIATLLIALAAVAFHTVRAARQPPVDTIRAE